jgi:hypothetical protein
MNQKSALTTLLLFLAIATKSQTIGLKFEGIGDNREFFSGFNKSETILGSRITVDAGTTIDEHHQVRAGFCYFYEFGSELLELKPKPIMYYRYNTDRWNIGMGSMPRNEVLNYPLAIISDVYGYYRPTFEGLYTKYQSQYHHFSAWADWVSRQDTLRREQFMAGFTGESRWGNFMLRGWLYLFHNAGRMVRLPGESIEDNLGMLVLAGYDFSNLVPFDLLTIETGWLNSMFRNRGSGKKFGQSNSSYTQIEAAHKGYGIKATYHLGDKHYFEHGDLFFRNTTNYLRLGLYFTPINHPKVQGRFTWSFHIAHGEFDNQQQFSLSYFFNR